MMLRKTTDSEKEIQIKISSEKLMKTNGGKHNGFTDVKTSTTTVNHTTVPGRVRCPPIWRNGHTAPSNKIRSVSMI
jgi:hypothetical protein